MTVRAGIRRSLQAPVHADSSGFALLTVLWVLVGLAALGAAVSVAGGRALHAARNRVNLTRAAWLAEGCGASVRAVIGRGFTAARDQEGRGISHWAGLDRHVALSPLIVGANLDYALVPAGRAVNVNSATPSQLRRLFGAMRLGALIADSLADAVVDWRDSDEIEGRFGAEGRWYEQRGRLTPRNGPFANVREIGRVRGLEHLDLVGFLDVEPARISLQHASRPVLYSLPGFTREVVELVAARQQRGREVGSLQEIGAAVSSASRDSIMANFVPLSQAVTTEPDAWVLTCRASSGSPPVTATVELRLALAGSRVAVVRWRSWP